MARKQSKRQPKSEGNNSNVQIIVALIGVIGAIIVGLFSFPPFQRLFENNPTPTNVTTSTPAESVTVTPTGVVLQPTPALTVTPLPVGRTLFRDEFADNKSKWYVKGDEAKIIAGKYTHKVNCPSDNESNYCGFYFDMPYSPPRNFRMEIDVAIVESSAGADVAIGFQLRRIGRDHYYLNYFVSQGYYNLGVVYRGSANLIIPETSTDAINRSIGAVNRLGIGLHDFSLTPIINGQAIGNGEDGTLTNPGKSFLVILISRGSSATIDFDNILIQEAE
jgi:hypothetical protein